MAKLKAGDVVEIISGLNKGERGTVGSPNAGTENGKTLVSVYGDVKYIVPEDSLRLANAARNAKFKVGDKVKVKNPPHHTSDEVGVIKKISGTGRPGDPVMAEVHYGEGATWGNYGVIYASPSIMRLANAVSNAKDAEGNIISVGDTVILAEEGDADNPKEFKVKSLEGHYVYLGNLRHEYDKDLLVYNAHKSVRSSNAVVRNALATLGSGIEAANATVDVSKIEADVNAWIAAIRQAAKAKRQAHEIGKRIARVSGQKDIRDNPGLESVLKKANSVYDDASYVKTSQSDFATVFAY